MSHDEQSLSRAIEASLNYTQTSDSYSELPLEERIRKGDWFVLSPINRPAFPDRNPSSPVALRPTQSTLVYAALLLHALYFVPQVRQYVADFRPDLDNEGDGEGGLSGNGGCPYDGIEPSISFMFLRALRLVCSRDFCQHGSGSVDRAQCRSNSGSIHDNSLEWPHGASWGPVES